MKLFKSVLLIVITCFYISVSAQDEKLTRKIKDETVMAISQCLKENYVYPDTGLKMGNFIQQQLKSGAYDTIQTPVKLASSLTLDLLSVYHDGHLSIGYEPAFNASTDVGDKERMFKFRKRVNYGFEKAEILPGNIGYLKINGFFEPDNTAKEMALAAFHFVSNSEALVLDLRNNMGGDPGMVSFICGFLFEKKTLLNYLYSSKDKSTTAYWAIPNRNIKTLYNLPVYVLTSSKTFSAGEELTYDLQTQKRAIVIGEITAGGAHPVQPFNVGNGFTANVPFARAINPITKSDWESVGVVPDKKVPADDALKVAQALIMKK